MEVVRKPGNGTVPFATVAFGDVFAYGGALFQRVKVPGDDSQFATDLATGIARDFIRETEVVAVAGHFEET